jgi:predicted TIM-barrel fold metal-dependent hydrolase
MNCLCFKDAGREVWEANMLFWPLLPNAGGLSSMQLLNLAQESDLRTGVNKANRICWSIVIILLGPTCFKAIFRLSLIKRWILNHFGLPISKLTI